MRPLRLVLPIAVLQIGLLGASVGCKSAMAPAQTMTTSAEVPSSEGTIKAFKTGNGNTSLIVRAKHLAPPARLTPKATVYVVWVKPPSGMSQNVGPLSLDSDLNGNLDTVTPYDHFNVTITPEPDINATQPTHPSVLSLDVRTTE